MPRLLQLLLCSLLAVHSFDLQGAPSSLWPVRPPGLPQNSQSSLPQVQSRFHLFLRRQERKYIAANASGIFDLASAQRVGALRFFAAARYLPGVGASMRKVLEARLRKSCAKELAMTLTRLVRSLGHETALNLLPNQKKHYAREQARNAINRSEATKAEVWPVAWVEEDRQVLCVVEELELSRCIGVHPLGEFSRNRFDVAVCIIDLSSDSTCCVLPLKLLELKSRFRNTTLETSFRQLCIYGYTAIAHREHVDLLCLDRSNATACRLCSGSFDGKVEKGVITTFPLLTNREEISALVSTILEAAVRECRASTLPSAREKGLWGGLRASGNAIARRESRYGSIWELREGAAGGRLIKLVTRLHDCQHGFLAGGLLQAFNAAKGAIKDAESATKIAIKDAEIARLKAIIDGISNDTVPTSHEQLIVNPTAANALQQQLEQLEQLRLWLGRVNKTEGRFCPPPDSGCKNADEAAWEVRKFACILDLYISVQSTAGYAQIEMTWRGYSVGSTRGFEVWNSVGRARKKSSLRSFITDILLLCEVQWVHWDCRVENIVVDVDLRLAAIDFDWVQAPERLAVDGPPSARQTPNLWYAASEARLAGSKRLRDGELAIGSFCPKLYLAWQAYLTSVLLLKATRRNALTQWLDSIAEGHDGCEAGDFDTFVKALIQEGWNNSRPATAVALTEMVLSVAEHRLSTTDSSAVGAAVI